jgi:hypothetical protein
MMIAQKINSIQAQKAHCVFQGTSLQGDQIQKVLYDSAMHRGNRPSSRPVGKEKIRISVVGSRRGDDA